MKFYNEIDGIDLSLSLQTFNNINQHQNIKYRQNVLIIHDNWRNSTAFINDQNYKLILGYTGTDQIFHEPQDQWAISKQDRELTWYFCNIINDFIFYVLGPDYFVFEWASLVLTAKYYDYIHGAHSDFFNKHADGLAKSLYDDRKMLLPYISWTDLIEKKKNTFI